MRSVIFLSVFLVFLSSQCIQSLENVNMADVAIAFNVTDYAKIPDAYNDSIATFLDMFTQDGASFGEDKLRVSVVQYSSNVKVLIPLQMGTSADAIKKATVIDDGNNSKSLPSEDVAGAVWKAVFRDPNDHRPFVPKLVVIVAISNAADLPGINVAAAFNDLGKNALARLQDALKTCPYDNDNIPCYYEFKKCLVRVSFDLDKVQYDNRKYCLSAIPCPNGDQGCRTQCEKVSTPTNCIVSKIPTSMDSETVFHNQKCMAFDNYSSAMEPCENSPWSTGSNGNTSAKPSDQRGAATAESKDGMVSGWEIAVVGIITFLVGVYIGMLVMRPIVKRKLDAGKLKAFEAKLLNDEMKKKHIDEMKKKFIDDMKKKQLNDDKNKEVDDDTKKEFIDKMNQKLEEMAKKVNDEVWEEPDSSRSSMSLSRQSYDYQTYQGMEVQK